MFFSSYAPLFLMFAFVNRSDGTIWLTLVILSGVSLAALATVMTLKLKEKGPRLVVKHARPTDGEVLAYIATYLLPFLGLDLTNGEDVALLVGFLAVLMIVYINSNMLFVNPALSLAGFRAFEVEDAGGHVYSVITKRSDFEIGAVIRPAQVTRYIRLEGKGHDAKADA